jgi:HEPN domain-containing protein
MNDQPALQIWLDRVSYDLDTARAMLQTGRLIYVVFMCQQSLEKGIKALLTFQGKEVIPIHNLRRLAENASISQVLDDSTLIRLDFLSNYYLNARYKEDIQQLSKGISEKVASDFVDFTEGLIKWLREKMKQ